MEDRASARSSLAALRESIERVALAAVGAAALTGDRIEQLADEISSRGGMRREEATRLLEDVVSRWRGEAGRVGERAGSTLGAGLRELGLVTREEYEELELRVAQLEHRLRLVERGPSPSA